MSVERYHTPKAEVKNVGQARQGRKDGGETARQTVGRLLERV